MLQCDKELEQQRASLLQAQQDKAGWQKEITSIHNRIAKTHADIDASRFQQQCRERQAQAAAAQQRTPGGLHGWLQHYTTPNRPPRLSEQRHRQPATPQRGTSRTGSTSSHSSAKKARFAERNTIPWSKEHFQNIRSDVAESPNVYQPAKRQKRSNARASTARKSKSSYPNVTTLLTEPAREDNSVQLQPIATPLVQSANSLDQPTQPVASRVLLNSTPLVLTI